MRADAADWALAALTLVESSVDDNRINRDDTLSAFPVDELLIGLVVLAGSLRASLAASWGLTTEQLDEQTRAMFLDPAALDFGAA